MRSRLKEITQQHKDLVVAAWGELGTWRDFLVGIDGRDNSGKSTLARFLAWQMDMPAIETDLFLVPNEDGLIRYRNADLKRLIEARLNKGWPVIVEGPFLLMNLDKLGFTPNYLICMENQSYKGSDTWQDAFASYENDYAPREQADFVFSWKED